MHSGITPQHCCLLYNTEQEHHTPVTSFIQEGLSNNEKIIYIHDFYQENVLHNMLIHAGVDPDYFLQRGQLQFVSADTTYCRGQVFDASEMVNYLRAEAVMAVNEHFHGLRVTGEMTWALYRISNLDQLLHYEIILNHHHPWRGLCQYDRRYFPPDFLLDIASLHPVILANGRTFHNPMYPISSTLLTTLLSNNSSHSRTSEQ